MEKKEICGKTFFLMYCVIVHSTQLSQLEMKKKIIHILCHALCLLPVMTRHIIILCVYLHTRGGFREKVDQTFSRTSSEKSPFNHRNHKEEKGKDFMILV